MPDFQKPSLTKFDGAQTQHDRSAQAVFIGWQWTSTGKLYPLYNNSVEGHLYFGSTVSDKTLRRLGLDIPQTPPPHLPLKNT